LHPTVINSSRLPFCAFALFRAVAEKGKWAVYCMLVALLFCLSSHYINIETSVTKANTATPINVFVT
jgi:predicted MarR family transcription regulator